MKSETTDLSDSVTQDVVRINACRVCNNRALTHVLSLGELYVSNFMEGQDAGALKAPLDLVLCDRKNGGCGLLQLLHNVTVNAMYFNYWYKSGMNPVMRKALADISSKASKIVSLSPGDLVLDIGCNDGTLLRSYPVGGLELTGFDPARNLVEEARVGTTKIINDFFNAEAFARAFGPKKAKVITSIAMFYDLQDPNKFVSDIRTCLHEKGIWIIQMSYLPLMLTQNAFDNICHEHLEYYSLLSLESLLRRHNFRVADMELNDVNGGSFRVTVTHASCDTLNIPSRAALNVQVARDREAHLKLNDIRAYTEFAARIQEIKRQLVGFIQGEVARGKKVYVYGASTKGNTLLQYFGLTDDLIKAAVERNPDKWGKKTVGTHIPIISEDQARGERPDYFLILPWHFLENFKVREAEYLAKGGKFIVPLPTFQVIGK